MKSHRRLSLSAEPTTGTTASRAGSLHQNHGLGGKILPATGGGIEMAGVLPAAAERDITVADVQSVVTRLLQRRDAMEKQYREKCSQVERHIGGLLQALRQKLGARLKHLSGDDCPALTRLSELLNGLRRWTPDTLHAVLARLAAMERGQQQQRKARP